jgi:hypothetical protein
MSEALKLPPKRPDYRGDRNHGDFLTTLSQRFIDYNVFVERLESALGLCFEVSETTLAEELESCNSLEKPRSKIILGDRGLRT